MNLGNHPILSALAAAVPLHIMDLQAHGGPAEHELQELPNIAHILAERGDNLLYRSNTKGESAKLFNQLAHSIAILAFTPGGITVFGQHWEAK